MLGFLKKTAELRGRIGIALLHDRMALAVVLRGRGRPMLERCETVPLPADTGPAGIGAALRGIDLPRLPVSTVLDGNAYRLVLLEAPEVPGNELKAAVRWRLKEAVDLPIEQAVVDVFDQPARGRAGQGRMVFAVAAQRAAVDQHAAAFAGQPGFDVIDIPELCLRNIAAALPAAARGVALLHLGATTASIVLVQGRTFYLSRQMDLGATIADEGAGDDSGIVLELHRSLDYYERHFDQPPITNVVIAPNGRRASELALRLGQETGFQVSALDLDEVVDVPTELAPALQSDCLLAVGAALREERRSL